MRSLADVLAEAIRNGHPDDGSDADEAVLMDAERYANHLENAGYMLVECGLDGLVGIARAILDSVYPEDLFGRDGMFSGDAGARFTQHLRDALAAVDSEREATP